MNLQNLKRYSIIAGIFLILMAVCFYAGRWNRENKGSILTDTPTPVHDVNMKAPVKAKDKQVLREQNVISKSVEKGPGEVTTTGRIEDDSGTRHVASVLNPETGESVIVQNRTITERMHRSALGIGAGFYDGQFTKAAYYEYAGLRVWDFYVIGRGEVFLMNDGRKPWNALIAVEYRW